MNGQNNKRSPVRSLRNELAEAFVRGLQVGADEPEIAGDGDEMYRRFREWADDDPTLDNSPSPVVRQHGNLDTGAALVFGPPENEP